MPSLSRRDFLRRASLAIAGGLIVGDAALELAERLAHRTVFALGGMPLDVQLTTGLSAGMFSTYLKVSERYKGVGVVTVDGVAAQVSDLGNGWHRVSRFLGEGPVFPVRPNLLHSVGVTTGPAQLEVGRFPTSFIPTDHRPATRPQEQMTWHLDCPLTPRTAYSHTFTRHGEAWDVVGGRFKRYAPHQPRTEHSVNGSGPFLLLEGTRTNYLLHQSPPNA